MPGCMLSMSIGGYVSALGACVCVHISTGLGTACGHSTDGQPLNDHTGTSDMDTL